MTKGACKSKNSSAALGVAAYKPTLKQSRAQQKANRKGQAHIMTQKRPNLIGLQVNTYNLPALEFQVSPSRICHKLACRDNPQALPLSCKEQGMLWFYNSNSLSSMSEAKKEFSFSKGHACILQLNRMQSSG